MLSKTLVCLLATVLAVTGEDRSRQCLQYFQEVGAVKIDLKQPLNYSEVKSECENIDRVLLNYIDGLNDDEKGLCGDQPVPINKFANKDYEQYDYDDLSALWTLDVTSGRTWTVSTDFNFSCVLCQGSPVTSTYTSPSDYREDFHYFAVYLLSADPKLSDQVAEKVKIAAIKELGRQLHPMRGIDTQFIRSWLDQDQRLQMMFHTEFPVINMPAKANTEINVLNNTYIMRVEDVSICPGGDTVDADGAKTSWPPTLIDSKTFNRNAETGKITSRACVFNKAAYHSEWETQLARLIPIWEPCKYYEDQYGVEEDFMSLLGEEVLLRHANMLHNFTLAPVNRSTLLKVTRHLSKEMAVRKALYDQTCRDLAVIAANYEFDKDYIVASVADTSFMIVNLKGSKPYVGFRKESDKVGDITFSRKPTLKGRAPYAFDISAGIVEHHTRMSFVVSKVQIRFSKAVALGYRLISSTDVTVMFPRPGEVSATTFTSYGNHHVDITYEDTLNKQGNVIYICLAWDNVLGEWIKEGCKTTYSNVDGFSACRCSAKFFYMQDDVPMAKYTLQLGQQGPRS